MSDASQSPPSPIDKLDAKLRELLDRMPVEPGVYLMKDKKGKVIYVGKARSLRSRVRSYFTRGSSDDRAFVPLLARLLGDIETVVVDNEKEALLLENNLIKRHQPRFNVKLVDDKNYLVLRLDPRARYPRLEVTRRIGTDGARYFGPYHSATSCRQTLHVVNRHFKLRTCSDQVLESRKRPCLQYQIKRCDAPCVYPIPAAEYAEQVRDVTLFLEGKDQELVARLRARMKDAAQKTEFEVAAAVRDQIASLEKALTEQHVVSGALVDQDVIGFYREGASVELAVLHVRQGKLLGRRTFSFGGQEFPDEEIVSSFVSLYYDLGSYIPDEVLLHCSIEDAETKADWLREKRSGSQQKSPLKAGSRAVEVLAPRRGPRAKLVELADKNAAAAFTSRRDKSRDREDALAKMQERLGLKRLPQRIECYDISHIQGAATVASMVVFEGGEPAKAEYRRFKVRSAENDDFKAMYEVLSRRFRRALKPDPDEPAGKWAMPDLVVIDGGKGQLGAALAAMRDTGVDLGLGGIDVIGLAKERVFEDAAKQQPAGDGDSALQEAGAGDVAPPAAAGDVAAQQAPARNAMAQQTAGDAAARQAPVTNTAMQHVGSVADAALQQSEGDRPRPKPGTPGAPRGKQKRRFAKADEGGTRRPDRVFLPRIKDPIPLRPNTAELFVLSRIRDEAHRFAITYHRSLRSRRTLRSALGDIPGVGDKRQRELLRRFGSVKKVREATVDELAATPGMSRAAALAVRRFFDAAPPPAAAARSTRDADEALAALPSAAPEPAEADDPGGAVDAEDAGDLMGAEDAANLMDAEEVAEEIEVEDDLDAGDESDEPAAGEVAHAASQQRPPVPASPLPGRRAPRRRLDAEDIVEDAAAEELLRLSGDDLTVDQAAIDAAFAEPDASDPPDSSDRPDRKP